jgi:hypothetical protein
VVIEFSAILNSYRISNVIGDRYAGEKSDLYRELLPAINTRMVDLLDDVRLLAQIVGLERRTARGGRDSIDHAPAAHDDVANAAAGVGRRAGVDQLRIRSHGLGQRPRSPQQALDVRS